MSSGNATAPSEQAYETEIHERAKAPEIVDIREQSDLVQGALRSVGPEMSP
jgi:hypothetical protein